MHPSITNLLKFFDTAHLPPFLAAVSEDFGVLARLTAERNPNSPETTAAIRKLLEAKDCAVRAYLELRDGRTDG